MMQMLIIWLSLLLKVLVKSDKLPSDDEGPRRLEIDSEVSEIETSTESSSVPQFETRVWYTKSYSYRLPNDSTPIHYDLWIKTDVDKDNFDFSGRAKIHIKIVSPTQLITLHYREIEIEKVDLLNSEGNLTESNLAFTCNETLEFLLISLPNKKNPDDEIILVIRYTGKLRNDNAGFYRASYQSEANETVWYATTQFESTDARHAMPCYDEPWIRAPISLEIQHDKSYEAISNMPIWRKSSIEGTDYVTSKFRKTPPMQTYLLAFVVSNFKYKSSNETKVKQRVYAKPQSIDNGDADFVAYLVGLILSAFEQHLGVPYPLIKLDHIAITDFKAGAMENFGLITYKESLILLESVQYFRHSRKSVTRIVAHEIAHQYFGNIVSPIWWSYTWLNEGFASLYECYVPSLLNPYNDHMSDFESSKIASFSADVEDSKPLNFYVASPKAIEKRFGTISYKKGGTVLRMFQEALTVPTFTKGLKYYLTEMFYKAATPSDLHRNLQKAYDEDFPGSGLNIEKLMSTWEDQAGYPTVTVHKTDGKTFLTQKRVDGGEEIYAIPISYTTSSKPEITPIIWMTTKSMELPDVPVDDWIFLNDRSGYYKVKYEEVLMKMIKSNVFDNFPVDFRAKLFKELLLPLAEPIEALEILSNIANENEATVWKNVVGVIKNFLKILFGTPAALKFNAYIQSLLKPHLERLGFEKIESESKDDSSLRDLIKPLSCLVFAPECLEHAQKTFFESDHKSSICDAMRYISQENYTALLSEALESERNYQIMFGLGCSLDKKLISNFLNLILNSSLKLSKNQNKKILLTVLHESSVGCEVALDFIRDHYEEINPLLPLKFFSNFFRDEIGFINTEENILKFRTIVDLLLKANLVQDLDEEAFKKEIEKKRKWISVEYVKIEKWLDDKTLAATSQRA